jgi:para-nitrobenzyl esterase
VQHRHVAPTWEYQFSHGYEPLGAVHIWDMQYLFGFRVPLANQPIDQQLTAAVQRYWTNFARSGDPNGPNLVDWPQAGASAAYLDFTSQGPVVERDLRGRACEPFNRLIEAELAGLR